MPALPLLTTLCFAWPLRLRLQPLDQKSGMVNIRADDDQEPEDVLAQFSLEQRVRCLHLSMQMWYL